MDGSQELSLDVLPSNPGIPDGAVSEHVRGCLFNMSGKLATIHTASDYSYSASSYAGENSRIVGDAAAARPLVSARCTPDEKKGSMKAAIAALIRGDCPESDAAAWHTQRVGVSYTRFLIVVLSAYKQIRAQSEVVLSDVGEDNFDTAFSFLRPVIQGNADLGPRLSESEMQNPLDFCASLFNPFDQGIANDLRQHLEGLDDSNFLAHGVEKFALMDITAPPLPAKEVQSIARDPSFLPALENCSAEDAETEVQRILERINARRLIH